MSADRVSFASPRGEIRYEDTADHFDNGLLRLLRIEQPQFEQWLAAAETHRGDLLTRLHRGFGVLEMNLPYGAPGDTVEPGPDGIEGSLWHRAIAQDYTCGIARAGDLAWLVRQVGYTWEWVNDPPYYGESYFESPTRAGYTGYLAESEWRIEKAHRQLREIRDATGVSRGRCLDVGSGYGFFRKALDDEGWEHDGLELSEHARQASTKLFGFESFDGALEENVDAWRDRYDLITFWDLIEHVPNPVVLLDSAKNCLRPGGVLAIKTPNIDCPEAEVFGAHYHSLKREHLIYFSPTSLERATRRAGLEPVLVTSVSHLLVGFLGAERADSLGRSLRGADLVAYYRRS